MATLILKPGTGPERVIQLHLGVNHFGRSPANDFVIEHPTVSAFHCHVELTDDGVIVQDCDSTNGTFINGEPIREAKLIVGATLQLGDVELYVESTDVQITIPEVQPQPAPPKRSVLMVKDRSGYCPEHPSNLATWQCLACQLVLCDDCVREVRRRGKLLRLCPKCNEKVEPLGKDSPDHESIFARLAKTIKLPFVGRRGEKSGS